MHLQVRRMMSEKRQRKKIVKTPSCEPTIQVDMSKMHPLNFKNLWYLNVNFTCHCMDFPYSHLPKNCLKEEILSRLKSILICILDPRWWWCRWSSARHQQTTSGSEGSWATQGGCWGTSSSIQCCRVWSAIQTFSRWLDLYFLTTQSRQFRFQTCN